jgi:hypothetical protein
MEIRPKLKGALVNQSNFFLSNICANPSKQTFMTKEFGTDFRLTTLEKHNGNSPKTNWGYV